MQVYWEVVVSLLFFLYLALSVHDAIFYLKMPDTTIPKKSHKMYFVYKHGEYTVKGLVWMFILAGAGLFVMMLSKVMF